MDWRFNYEIELKKNIDVTRMKTKELGTILGREINTFEETNNMEKM
jgi:hypothetical protein